MKLLLKKTKKPCGDRVMMFSDFLKVGKVYDVESINECNHPVILGEKGHKQYLEPCKLLGFDFVIDNYSFQFGQTIAYFVEVQ